MSTDRGAEPSLGGRGSANEMCSGCGAILPCLGPPFAAAATNIVITIDRFLHMGKNFAPLLPPSFPAISDGLIGLRIMRECGLQG